MSFLDDLARSADSPTSIWHQFVVAHHPRRDEWFLFVEGKLDTPFYASALRRILGTEARVVDFRCRGKEGVWQARADVRRTHPRCTRTLFFIDKDFDDLLGCSAEPAPDVFQTDVYSIENYLVSSEALEVVWQQIWALSTTDASWARVNAHFEVALRRFYRLMLPISAWIVCARLAGMRPNLNNIRMTAIVVLRDGLPTLRRAAFRELQKSTSCSFCPSMKEWRRQIKALQRATPKGVTRGKFELWFFCQFLDSVLGKLKGRTSERPVASIPPAAESMAVALLGKLSLPPQLVAFIQSATQLGAEGHCLEGAQRCGDVSQSA
jgi:hypothetical protein